MWGIQGRPRRRRVVSAAGFHLRRDRWCLRQTLRVRHDLFICSHCSLSHLFLFIHRLSSTAEQQIESVRERHKLGKRSEFYTIPEQQQASCDNFSMCTSQIREIPPTSEPSLHTDLSNVQTSSKHRIIVQQWQQQQQHVLKAAERSHNTNIHLRFCLLKRKFSLRVCWPRWETSGFYKYYYEEKVSTLCIWKAPGETSVVNRCRVDKKWLPDLTVSSQRQNVPRVAKFSKLNHRSLFSALWHILFMNDLDRHQL